MKRRTSANAETPEYIRFVKETDGPSLDPGHSGYLRASDPRCEPASRGSFGRAAEATIPTATIRIPRNPCATTRHFTSGIPPELLDMKHAREDSNL